MTKKNRRIYNQIIRELVAGETNFVNKLLATQKAKNLPLLDRLAKIEMLRHEHVKSGLWMQNKDCMGAWKNTVISKYELPLE